MGQSTNAIAGWGLVWDNEDTGWNHISDELDDQISAIAAKHRVVINSHCSGECQMPYIAIEESRVVAHRGYPQRISGLVGRDPLPDWHDRIAAAFQDLCAMISTARTAALVMDPKSYDFYDLPPAQGTASWFLASNWL